MLWKSRTRRTIHKRQEAIGAKIDAAMHKSWDSIKHELKRDFNALSEELLQWERPLDDEAMKRENPKHLR